MKNVQNCVFCVCCWLKSSVWIYWNYCDVFSSPVAKRGKRIFEDDTNGDAMRNGNRIDDVHAPFCRRRFRVVSEVVMLLTISQTEEAPSASSVCLLSVCKGYGMSCKSKCWCRCLVWLLVKLGNMKNANICFGVVGCCAAVRCVHCDKCRG